MPTSSTAYAYNIHTTIMSTYVKNKQKRKIKCGIMAHVFRTSVLIIIDKQ